MSSNNQKVYQHKNKINNKSYIGITNRSLNERQKNGNGYYNQDFYNAILKYGQDNFEHILLKENLTKQEAEQAEQFYIQKFDSYNNGYNRSKGGESGFFGGHHTQETKDRISKTEKEQIKQNDPDRGLRLKKMLEEHPEIEQKRKENMEKVRPKKGTQEARDKCKKNCKKVLCVEENIVFNSVKEAGEQAKISNTGITHCLKGQQQTSGGYHQKYLEEE